MNVPANQLYRPLPQQKHLSVIRSAGESRKTLNVRRYLKVLWYRNRFQIVFLTVACLIIGLAFRIFHVSRDLSRATPENHKVSVFHQQNRARNGHSKMAHIRAKIQAKNANKKLGFRDQNRKMRADERMQDIQDQNLEMRADDRMPALQDHKQAMRADHKIPDSEQDIQFMEDDNETAIEDVDDNQAVHDDMLKLSKIQTDHEYQDQDPAINADEGMLDDNQAEKYHKLKRARLRTSHEYRDEILKVLKLGVLEECGMTYSNTTRPPPQVDDQETYANCKEPRVPNIVHLVWFYRDDHDVIVHNYDYDEEGYSEFTFRQMVSALSILKFIQPCQILFWYDREPAGIHWQNFNHVVSDTKLKMMKITAPQYFMGKRVMDNRKRLDIVKFEVLKHFGGIYMDLDLVIVKPLRPLRCYDYTLGREDRDTLPSSLVLAVPQSPFVQKMIDHLKNTFKNADESTWYVHTLKYPHELSLRHPEWIHVEENTINAPSRRMAFHLFDNSCLIDWSNNYAVHLWHNITKSASVLGTEDSLETIVKMRSTYGQIVRYIVYGVLDSCKTPRLAKTEM